MKFFQKTKYRIFKNIYKYGVVSVFLIIIFFSFGRGIIFASSHDNGTIPGSGNGTIPGSGNGTIPSSNLLEIKIDNPLGGDVSTIPDFIKKIIDIVVLIAGPIITLAVIYSGFLFVKAQGNPEALSTAKTTLLYTLIGAAVLLGAWFISETIVSTVNDIKSTT